MSRGVNKVILVGHLGQDPEVRTTPSGTTVTTVRVATSEQWTDRATGERKESTEWHTVVLWGRLGEVAGEYLAKGSQVYIEGKLKTEKWQAKDGTDRYSTKIQAQELVMLGGGKQQRTATADEYRRAKDGGYSPQPTGAGADFDDDIPF